MSSSIEIASEEAQVIGAAGTRVERRSAPLLGALERHAAVVLVVLAVCGLGVRLGGISRLGFAEDEINKLEAVRAYQRGDITPNAEHPMLMKTLILISMQAARVWNGERGVGVTGRADVDDSSGGGRIADETALRFPNILFGALTVFPLFLLTNVFFGRRTALVAAALWAFGINAITYNRVAKEDTLLVFFMLLAFYFYIRAKQASGFDPSSKRRNYILSGASFGLMFASKYFPHYLGLNMLYHHLFRVREREPGEPRGSTPPLFYFVILVAFLLANPALLLPPTWHYLDAYSSEQLLTHHGYLMGETLYENTMSKTPFGATPVYFYLLFLAIKVPLPLLVALILGLVETVRRRREPGSAFLLLMFVLWIVPYSLVGSKWLRYTLSLMPFLYMIAAVGIVALVKYVARVVARGGGDARDASAPLRTRVAISAAALALFVALPAWSVYASKPHYALYTNALASGRAGYYFPHDEFYDDGLREAIAFVAEHAPRGATLAHETPGVVRYYLERFNRTDLRSEVISDPRYNPLDAPADTYVILQRGRTYFENREEMDAVRAGGRFEKAHEVMVNGVSAVEVYASATGGTPGQVRR